METVTQNILSGSKLLIKGLIIGVIALALLIPSAYIKDLVNEREARQKEAITEVSSKWAGSQDITGPVIAIPYLDPADQATNASAQTRHLACFLPEQLHISGNVTPEEKHRGIYKVMLYTSRLHMKGAFGEIDPAKLNILSENMLWNEAFVQVNISDVKGLNEELKIRWNNRDIILSPNEQKDGSLYAPLHISGVADLVNASFDADLQLRGSEQLHFTPVGKSTTVQLSSSWPHPSFSGNILPQNSEVKKNGFSATWKSMAYKRNFPQQWKNSSALPGNAGTAISNAGASSFGVDLFIPVNSYQKTMRSVKYAALCILLTFAAFFLIETTHQKSVHPFQYGLIGLALLLFYTLLLSFSEYTGFNLSYGIAAAATIALIAWFVSGILRSGRLSIILSLVLMLMYTYIFTLLQLQDYSLILGSIGLFITLAVVMHFSKKIQW